jgi:hypothetical protein
MIDTAWMILMTVLMLRTWYKVERCPNCSKECKSLDPLGSG